MSGVPPLSAQQSTAVRHGLDGLSTEDFIDRFWQEKVDWALAGDVTPEGQPVARVAGRHYVLNPMSSGRPTFLGFGGAVFQFVFADGRRITTNDVWTQGEIPLHLRRGALVDNADIERSDSGYAPPGVATGENRAQAWLSQVSRYALRTFKVEKWTEPAGRFESVRVLDEAEVANEKAYFEQEEIDADVTAIITGADADHYDNGGTTEHEDRTEVPVEQAHVVSSELVTPTRGWAVFGEEREICDHIVAVDIDHPCRLIPSSTKGHYHLIIDKPMPWRRYRRLLRALRDAGIVQPGYYSASVKRRGTHIRLPWISKDQA